MANKSVAHPVLAQKVAGKVSALRRRYPKLQCSEALTAYVHLLIQRDVLETAMLDGTLDARQWRALSEVSRAILSAGRSLGVIPAEPKAGTEPDGDEDDESEPEEQYESNLQRRARILQAEEPAHKSRRGKQKER